MSFRSADDDLREIQDDNESPLLYAQHGLLVMLDMLRLLIAAAPFKWFATLYSGAKMPVKTRMIAEEKYQFYESKTIPAAVYMDEQIIKKRTQSSLWERRDAHWTRGWMETRLERA